MNLGGEATGWENRSFRPRAKYNPFVDKRSLLMAIEQALGPLDCLPPKPQKISELPTCDHGCLDSHGAADPGGADRAAPGRWVSRST